MEKQKLNLISKSFLEFDFINVYCVDALRDSTYNIMITHFVPTKSIFLSLKTDTMGIKISKNVNIKS